MQFTGLIFGNWRSAEQLNTYPSQGEWKTVCKNYPIEKTSPTNIRCRFKNQNGNNEFKIHSNLFVLGS